MKYELAASEQLPVNSMQDLATAGQFLALGKMVGATNDAQGFTVAAICHQKKMSLLDFQATFHLRDGQISKKTDAIIADLYRYGGKHKLIHRTHEVAEAIFYFEGNEYTSRFTWEEAKQEPFIYRGGPNAQMAELKKPFDKRLIKDKYSTPRSLMQMLWARMVSDGVRAVCPLACQGMYPPEITSDFNDDLESGKTEVPQSPQSVDPVEAAKVVQAEVVDNVAVDYNLVPFETMGEGGVVVPAYTYSWAQYPEEFAKSVVDGSFVNPAITSGHIEHIKLIMGL